MKSLILIRHAKSGHDDPAVTDFMRTLTSRGRSDASEMGKRMRKKGVAIELFISSPALRARQTAELFCEGFHGDANEIQFEDTLYLAPPENFFRIIEKTDDRFHSIALIAHNPGITELANSLCDSVRIDHMPTGSVFAVTADVGHWRDFEKSNKRFSFFHHPKEQLF